MISLWLNQSYEITSLWIEQTEIRNGTHLNSSSFLVKKWLRVNWEKIKNININFSWPQLIFSTLMMILAQYGSLLIAASCESGIKSHFYGTFNKPQWLFIEKQSPMGSKPLWSQVAFLHQISYFYSIQRGGGADNANHIKKVIK